MKIKKVLNYCWKYEIYYNGTINQYVKIGILKQVLNLSWLVLKLKCLKMCFCPKINFVKKVHAKIWRHYKTSNGSKHQKCQNIKFQNIKCIKTSNVSKHQTSKHQMLQNIKYVKWYLMYTLSLNLKIN